MSHTFMYVKTPAIPLKYFVWNWNLQFGCFLLCFTLDFQHKIFWNAWQNGDWYSASAWLLPTYSKCSPWYCLKCSLAPIDISMFREWMDLMYCIKQMESEMAFSPVTDLWILITKTDTLNSTSTNMLF